MNENPAVSHEEYALSERDVLITRTDLSGRNVYANDAFLKSSGYPRDEAVGQLQNIVGHPDMPAEVFRDLWDTICKNQPWTGVIENRRKDGRFF